MELKKIVIYYCKEKTSSRDLINKNFKSLINFSLHNKAVDYNQYFSKKAQINNLDIFTQSI